MTKSEVMGADIYSDHNNSMVIGAKSTNGVGTRNDITRK